MYGFSVITSWDVGWICPRWTRSKSWTVGLLPCLLRRELGQQGSPYTALRKGWDLLRSGVFRSQELGEGLKNRYGRYLTDEITRTHQVRMTPRLLWFIGSLKAWGLVWKWIPIQNIIGLVMGSLSQWPGNNGLFPDIQTHLGHSFAASYSRKQLIPVQIRGPTEHQTDTCTHVLKDQQF